MVYFEFLEEVINNIFQVERFFPRTILLYVYTQSMGDSLH